MFGLAKTIERQLWSLERFGLTPAKLHSRATNRDEPRVVCVCVPKSGTHLLERTLCLHPRLYRIMVRTVNTRNIHDLGGPKAWLDALKPGQISFCHLPYSADLYYQIRERDVRLLFTVRDPRDVVVSDVFYIRRHTKHFLYDLHAKCPDVRSCIELSILGDKQADFPSVRERLKRYSGWLNSPESLTVRFEDLVGAMGGGDSTCQMQTLESLFKHLGMTLDGALKSTIEKRLFSSASPTFRKGRIGGWQDHFDADLRQLFKDVAGDVLIEYGYEKDYQW